MDTLLTTSSLTLNGGVLSTGATTGFNQTLPSLTFSDASALALGTGSHTLIFGTLTDASGGADTLAITGWAGNDFTSGTGGKIVFTISDAATANTNFATFLAKTQFSSNALGSATLVNSGGNVELVPTPDLPR